MNYRMEHTCKIDGRKTRLLDGIVGCKFDSKDVAFGSQNGRQMSATVDTVFPQLVFAHLASHFYVVVLTVLLSKIINHQLNDGGH